MTATRAGKPSRTTTAATMLTLPSSTAPLTVFLHLLAFALVGT
jgi:hypothetical protein